MDNILEPNSQFDFSQINCISPTALSGGNYFIRLLTLSQNPLYIRTPKCFAKSGILKSGKKMLCDLVFQHHDEEVLNFLEHLETFCQKQIFENKEKWFESGLTMVDIEHCFLSTTKSYKSGKYHSLRCNVPLRMGKCNLKIFNEQEQDVQLDEIKENTNIMSILEIQGIRCSVRSFQIEFELKQMMVLKPSDSLFEKCILTKHLGKTESIKEETESIKEEVLENTEIVEPVIEEVIKEQVIVAPPTPIEKEKTIQLSDIIENEPKYILETLNDFDTETVVEPDTETVVEQEKEIVVEQEKEIDAETIEKTININKSIDDTEELDAETKPLEKIEDATESIYVEENEDGLCEVDVEIPNDDEEINLKNPKEKHYVMYKDAKRKAKIARDLAISQYLEAKQIKHEYLLDDMCSDDEEMILDEKDLKEMELDDE